MASYILAGICFVGAGAALLNVTAPWVMAYTPLSAGQEGQSEWIDFSEEKIAELRAQGTPVFVDFTAKWCLICQANHFILTTDEVNKEFDRLGVVRMKADWTKSDEGITKALRRFGRNGVPLYVLYEGNTTSQPKILPQVLTPDTVLGYLREINQAVADSK
jgi:thiol:disulfide interchange protein